MYKVLMIGSSKDSGGGISSAIRLITKMPLWKENSYHWLGTQIQRGPIVKMYYALRAAFIAPLIMHKYDIVHFHMVPGTTLITQLPELLTAKIFRRKVIMEVHIGNQLIPYSKSRFFKWWLRQADQVLLLANKWKKLYVESYRDVGTPSDVLYNACEMIPAASRERKSNVILFAGSMDDNKAPDILLRAWGLLKNMYPDWKILFLGSGDIDKYQQLAKVIGVEDCVEFTGYIVGDRKKKIFEEASIYCMCSYLEGFPMVVLEAWTHCISVITTPVGGLPDVIDDGKNCLTFNFGDYKALADCLQTLIENPGMRAEIGENGYDCARKNFSLNRISEKLDTIYSDLINKTSK